MGFTDELCNWAADLTYDDIPESTRQAVKLQIMSVLAAVRWGARSSKITKLARAVMRGYGNATGVGEANNNRDTLGSSLSTLSDGPVSSAVLGHSTSLWDAIYLDTAASVVHDFDDYLFAGHTGHSAVIVSLRVAELCSKEGQPVDGKSFLTAVVAANEAGGRLGASMLFGPHNGQMWSYIHLLSAAIAASKLLGLDSKATESAVGLAFSQPNYPLVATFMGSDAKALIASQPSVDGTKGAFLAASGLEGAPGILEDRSGFWAAFKKDALRQMFSGFGRAWVSESLSYKIYPGCAYLDTAQDALFEIAAEYRKSTGGPLAAEDIESVRVEAGMLTSGMETMSGWYRKDRLRPTNMNFSVALTGALSIIAGRLSPDLFEPAYLEPMHDRIVELAQKFSIVHSPELTAQMSPRKEDPKAFDLRRVLSKKQGALDDVDFSTYESRFPAVVTMRLKSGKSFTARQDIPLGGAGRPREETCRLVRRKLAEAFASSPGAAEAIGRFIENLEGSEDAAELASLSIRVEDGTQEVTTLRPLGDTE